MKFGSEMTQAQVDALQLEHAAAIETLNTLGQTVNGTLDMLNTLAPTVGVEHPNHEKLQECVHAAIAIAASAVDKANKNRAVQDLHDEDFNPIDGTPDIGFVVDTQDEDKDIALAGTKNVWDAPDNTPLVLGFYNDGADYVYSFSAIKQDGKVYRIFASGLTNDETEWLKSDKSNLVCWIAPRAQDLVDD